MKTLANKYSQLIGSFLMELLFLLTLNVPLKSIKKQLLIILLWFSFGLWCLTPLSTTLFQLYRTLRLVLLVEEKYPGKTTDLLQVTDKLNHRMLYRVQLDMNEIRTHNFGGDMH